MKHLQDIVKTLHAPHVEGNTAVEILDVTADSRAVKEGSLFIALDGATVDGHDYVNKAVEAGAVAVLVSKPIEISSDVCVITVEDTRAAMMACVPYFFDYPANSMRMIGVTGTNGKTTTTTLLTKVLEGSGKPVHVGGNIGDSLSEVAYSMPADGFLVAELSSYQLETIKHFRPIGAIMLNITPDHLARHKTMENYIAAKERIFENQLSTDYLVLNIDDPVVADMEHRSPSHILKISQKKAVENGAYYADGQCYIAKDGVAKFVIGNEDIHIPGSHNIENILTVIALSHALGVPAETIHRIISEFHGVEHRLERVKTIDGITFYNDSKATNVDSVVKALESFDQQVILLAGGHDKMTPLEDFMELVKEKTKAVIFMGEAADRFETAAKEAGVKPIYRALSMKEAVEQGYKLAETGDIVLLSPACSSFDWYSCFEERGDDFKRCVHMLQEGGHH